MTKRRDISAGTSSSRRLRDSHSAETSGVMRVARKSAKAPATTRARSYAAWIADVKLRIHAAHQRAVLAVNRELLSLYWHLGRDILDRQQRGGWGAGRRGQGGG